MISHSRSFNYKTYNFLFTYHQEPFMLIHKHKLTVNKSEKKIWQSQKHIVNNAILFYLDF